MIMLTTEYSSKSLKILLKIHVPVS